MYLYFDKRGILKEVINDRALRQGSFNANKIYAFFEELDVSIPRNLWVSFRLPDGSKIPEFELNEVEPVELQVPFNARRDLKFFKYYESYPFFEIPLQIEVEGTQYNALSQFGSVACSIRLVSNEEFDAIDTTGLVVFDVEESVDGSPEIHWDEYISLAQFSYLLSLLGQYYTKEQVEDYIDIYIASGYYNKTEIDAMLALKADKATTYTKTEMDTALNGKLDKKDTTGTYVYTHNGTIQGEVVYTPNALGNGIVQRDSNGEINVPTTPTDNGKATSKQYVDTGLNAKQDTLVNQVNIKAIKVGDNDPVSLLGTGYVQVGSGSGGGAWGEITGDIQDQTDLQNEFQDIREVAEGKNKSIVVEYSATAPTENTFVANKYKRQDGTFINTWADYQTYIGYFTFGNAAFNSQNNSISLVGYYLITTGNVVIKPYSYLKTGDIIWVVETDVPDRWYDSTFGFFYKLETSKIDLTNYATKTELADKSDLSNIASVYDATNTYTVGEVVIYNGKLYRCTTAITTAEAWDSTHWEQITVANGFVNLTGTQTISGRKTFDGGIDTWTIIRQGIQRLYFDQWNSTVSARTLLPLTASDDLGSSASKWQNCYFGGTIYTKEVKDTRTNASLSLTCNDDYAQVLINHGNNNSYAFQRTTLRPVGDGLRDLGTSSQQWKDLYLSGNINLKGGTKEAVITCDSSAGLLIRDATTGAGITTGYISGVGPAITPYGATSLGKSDVPWKDLYLSGTIYGASNVFNVINASDIANNTLTQAQYDLITNGKPTLIKGTYLGHKNMLITYWNEYSTTWRALAIAEGQVYSMMLNTTTMALTEGGDDLKLYKIAILNGKSIPAYPSSTGTFDFQCVNGTLAWNEQWYGTQTQYDNLGTYDSNTTYNIIED